MSTDALGLIGHEVKVMNALLIFSIFLLLVLGSLTTWLSTHWRVRGQSQQDKGPSAQISQPYAQVDEKARAARGADEGAVRELTDAVLLSVIGNKLASVLVGRYKERLVRAEINYRRGQRVGISDSNIVRVLDELARELNAPEYAKTDEDEVRETRLAIAYMLPHLIPPQSLSAEEQSSRELPYTVSPTMSPVEAVFVARFLIMQKEINESSQITRAERADIKMRVRKLVEAGFQLTSRQRGEVMRALIGQNLHPDNPQLSAEELAARAQQESEVMKNRVTPYLVVGIASTRYNEMQDVFRRAYSMKLSDAVALTNRSLELLGIEN